MRQGFNELPSPEFCRVEASVRLATVEQCTPAMLCAIGCSFPTCTRGQGRTLRSASTSRDGVAAPGSERHDQVTT